MVDTTFPGLAMFAFLLSELPGHQLYIDSYTIVLHLQPPPSQMNNLALCLTTLFNYS